MEHIFDLRLEQHLLSGVLRYPFTFPDIDGLISEADFKNKLHQTIWNQVKQTLRSGESVDQFIIAQKINNLALSFEDKISSVADYLEGLCLINVKQTSLKALANELKTISIRREIADTGQEISKAMYQHSDLKADEVVVLAKTTPSFASRSPLSAATFWPFLRSQSIAASKSPFVSVRALRQSIIPAPVVWRSLLISAAVIVTVDII